MNISLNMPFSLLQQFKMVRKKIDNRIRVMLENGVANKHRSLFVIVGDHGRDQVSRKDRIYGHVIIDDSFPQNNNF